MRSIATPRVHHVLVFLGSVLLGLWLRSEQVAHAWGLDCRAGTSAELIEVRRVEGNGDIAVQEMSWQGRLHVEVSGGHMGLEHSTPPFEYEAFSIELEVVP